MYIYIHTIVYIRYIYTYINIYIYIVSYLCPSVSMPTTKSAPWRLEGWEPSKCTQQRCSPQRHGAFGSQSPACWCLAPVSHQIPAERRISMVSMVSILVSIPNIFQLLPSHGSGLSCKRFQVYNEGVLIAATFGIAFLSCHNGWVFSFWELSRPFRPQTSVP